MVSVVGQFEIIRHDNASGLEEYLGLDAGDLASEKMNVQLIADDDVIITLFSKHGVVEYDMKEGEPVVAKGYKTGKTFYAIYDGKIGSTLKFRFQREKASDDYAQSTILFTEDGFIEKIAFQGTEATCVGRRCV